MNACLRTFIQLAFWSDFLSNFTSSPLHHVCPSWSKTSTVSHPIAGASVQSASSATGEGFQFLESVRFLKLFIFWAVFLFFGCFLCICSIFLK